MPPHWFFFAIAVALFLAGIGAITYPALNNNAHRFGLGALGAAYAMLMGTWILMTAQHLHQLDRPEKIVAVGGITIMLIGTLIVTVTHRQQLL